jgi:hypothetical protein
LGLAAACGLRLAACGLGLAVLVLLIAAGPISPKRGVRRGPQRLGGSVTLRSKTANPQ